MNEYFVISQIMISFCLLITIDHLHLQFRRERLRCRVRKLRDDLFDWMITNKQDFQSSEYRGVRQALNGVMRLSNSYGPVEFLVLLAIQKANDPELPQSELDLMVASPLKVELKRVQREAVHSWLMFLYAEGFVGYLLRSIVFCCRTTKRITQLNDAAMLKGEELFRSAREFGAPQLTGTQRLILDHKN